MNKFTICYNISKEIIDNYIKLLYNSNYKENSSSYTNMINNIKKLVLQEYILIHSMTLEEIVQYLDKDCNKTEYNLDVIPRIKNRLVAQKEILLGKNISSTELNLNSIPINIDFSIYDVILSIINLDIIKRLKNKIYFLNSNNNNDKLFIKSLKQKLNTSKIEFLFNSSPVEILSLYHNINIDEIPNIDINNIKNKIKKSNNIEINKAIETTLLIIFDKSINKLNNIENLNNNPTDIFYYLTIITGLETILSYMDKNLLKICYNYCSKLDNNSNLEHIKKLIKNKLNN